MHNMQIENVHVVVKCANCNKNHQSNDEHCEMFTALNPRKSADELSALYWQDSIRWQI